MAERPLLDVILDTSAWVGSLIIPANSLESHLGRYASQLAVWTHDDVYKLSIPGSATGLFFDGRAMLVCTMHQLKEFELSDVGLMLPDGSYLVTSSGSRTFRPGDYTKTTDAYDLVAFDFSKPEAEIPSLTRAFFPFEKVIITDFGSKFIFTNEMIVFIIAFCIPWGSCCGGDGEF